MGGAAKSLSAPFNAIGNFFAPDIPKPNTSSVNTDAELEKARNAVQSKEAEERRQRAAKRISSVLTGGLGLPGSAPTASATLQPTEARKSVLG